MAQVGGMGKSGGERSSKGPFRAKTKKMAGRTPLIRYTAKLKEVRSLRKSSKGKGSPRVTDRNTNPMFIDAEAESFFKEFENGPFIVERYVKLEDFSHIQVKELFSNLGIMELIKEELIYYPTLVAQFYANLAWNQHEIILTSRVNGVDFMLDSGVIASILHSSTEGKSPMIGTFEDFGWDRLSLLDTLCGVHAGVAIKRMSKNPSTFPVDLLTPKFKFIAKVFHFNVQPQCGHLDSIRMPSILAMCAGVSDTKLNIPYMILKNFMEAREKLILPCFLTLVFKYFGIEVEGLSPSISKANFTKFTWNRMLLPTDPSKTTKGETKKEKSVRRKQESKKTSPTGKKRKVNLIESDSDEENDDKTSLVSRIKKVEKDVVDLNHTLQDVHNNMVKEFKLIRANLKALCNACGATFKDIREEDSQRDKGKGKAVDDSDSPLDEDEDDAADFGSSTDDTSSSTSPSPSRKYSTRASSSKTP